MSQPFSQRAGHVALVGGEGATGDGDGVDGRRIGADERVGLGIAAVIGQTA